MLLSHFSDFGEQYLGFVRVEEPAYAGQPPRYTLETSPMKRTLFAAALCLSCLATGFVAGPAAAAPVPAAAMAPASANKILAEIDRRANAFKDQQYTASMKIMKGGELSKTLTFESKMQGLQKQYIHFTAPGDVAGMKILMQDTKTLYVYLPEFKKVRRVAAHAMAQGFLGGEFTYQDMTEVLLAAFYDAAVGGREGTKTTLQLTPKEGNESGWSRIDVVIDSTKGGVTEMRYYDGAGNHVRTQSREDWKKVGGELMPTKVSMANLKTGDTTVIELTDVRVNEGVDDGLFSRRQLLR